MLVRSLDCLLMLLFVYVYNCSVVYSLIHFVASLSSPLRFLSMCECVCLGVYLLTCRFVDLLAWWSVCLRAYLCMCVCLFIIVICVYVDASMSWCVYLFICLVLRLYFDVFVLFLVEVFVCVVADVFMCLSVDLSVC